MLLEGADGSRLELHVLGYQFPEVTADPWDSNSLMVSIRVVGPGRSWEAVDPCLTTWEAMQLVRWLAGAAVGPGAVVVRPFSAPNLTVTLEAASPDLDTLQIRVCFALESRPPWLAGPARGQDALCIDLELHRRALGRGAAELAGDLARFPQRGADPTL